MMKLGELYTRVIETTGLDVITPDSFKVAIKSCMADLTSRGYRTFCEKHLADFKTKANTISYTKSQNMIKFPLPKDVRKNLYIRVFFDKEARLATRYSLSNKRVACKYLENEFRSILNRGQAIYYIKGDTVIIEWDYLLGDIKDISYGYYKSLQEPNYIGETFEQQLLNTDIDIREEFENALVLYIAYFYYSRYIKDPERIQQYLSNYKYYVEDLTHELAYEDDYNEEDTVIKCEE